MKHFSGFIGTLGLSVVNACLFSSPEHEVLIVSFCDCPSSSILRRPLSTISLNNFLLLNHWANLDETWQGCSLGKAKVVQEIEFQTLVWLPWQPKGKKIAKSLKIFSETKRARALIVGM